MAAESFRALVVRERDNSVFTRAMETRTVDDLPAGDVLIRVHYSSLNYKDALSATGNKGVTRRYPHTPGIDAAGVVTHSTSLKFARGDEVIVIGYDLGMNTDGGYGEYIRVPADWVVKRPAGLTLRESMIYGTAGFTAAMAVAKMTAAGLEPEQGEVLVTGATGGVGSVAVAILAKEGYDVVAATGLVASPKLNTTVYPFILRSVSLLGIDSSMCTLEFRREIWQRLAGSWKVPQLADLAREVTLDELDPEIDRILRGGQRGRVLVQLGE